MIFEPGDVVLVKYPFTSTVLSKKRPALIVSKIEYNQQHKECVVMPITSQLKKSKQLGDTLLKDWKNEGLIKPSLIKGIVFTLEDSIIEKRIGHLSSLDYKEVCKSLHLVLEIK